MPKWCAISCTTVSRTMSACRRGEALIRSIGREPMQRDTLYRPVPEERRAASMIAAELEPIVLTPPRKRAAVG